MLHALTEIQRCTIDPPRRRLNQFWRILYRARKYEAIPFKRALELSPEISHIHLGDVYETGKV
jgi:hypothetical protein